ncbi:MAG: fatty acid desaturase [Micropepsaceae bacterium]
MKIDRMSLAHFAQRSAMLSTSIVLADLAFYALMVLGTITSDSLGLQLLFSFGAGTMIALTAIAGHDAGHQSFSNSKSLNRLFGTLAFLPALHPFALWEHHHNRIHHRFTAQLGLDNAFPPMTVEQYRQSSPWQRARYRFIRSLWGQPFFYLIDVWLMDMWLPFLKPDQKMTGRIWFDLALVYTYFAAFLAGAIALTMELKGIGLASATISVLIFTFAIPFLVWNTFISFLSIVQHTGPEVKWVLPTGLPSTTEQALAGTVHVVLPEWVDRLFHRIMQHQAHHVHVGIPLQHLVEAQHAVARTTGGMLVRVWTPQYHWQLTRECQLYDPQTNTWRKFADCDAPAVALDRAA